jgi:hypothetical protein
MDMKKLAMVAIVLTLTFAVGLESVNVAEGAGFSKEFIKNSDRAQSSGGDLEVVTQQVKP